jgi:hypothetical protein
MWQLKQFWRVPIHSEKYIPVDRAKLEWEVYRNIAFTNPIVAKCLRLRDKNVNANGYTVTASIFTDEGKNNEVEKYFKHILEDELHFSQLLSQMAVTVSTYGNGYYVFNKESKPVIHEPDLYKVYFSRLQGRALRYALVKDGQEMRGELGNLQQGEDIYHVKSVGYQGEPIAPSPIDACYEWVMYYLHALQANNQIASTGWINTVLFPSDNDPIFRTWLDNRDEQGRKNSEGLMQKLRDLVGGSKNAGRGAILPPGLKEPIEIGKTNHEMQYVETQQVVAEQIAWAFGFTLSDLGKDVTYNNATNFDYVQYDIFGREFETINLSAWEKFILPNYLRAKKMDQLADALRDGLIDIKFNPPADPDKNEAIEADLKIMNEQIKHVSDTASKNLILNEFRNKYELEPLELPEMAEPVASYRTVEGFAVNQTPTEKALASREYKRATASGDKGFEPHLQGKIEQQLNDFATDQAKKKQLSKL